MHGAREPASKNYICTSKVRQGMGKACARTNAASIAAAAGASSLPLAEATAAAAAP